MAKNSGVEKAGLSAIPLEERKNWPGIAFIWAGSCCCVPALMVGAGITMGLSFFQAALSMILGYGVCVVMMILMSILAADRGVPAVVSISGAFGEIGAGKLVSFIIAFCFTCWFGFQAVVCGEAFAAIVQSMGLPLPGVVSTIIWGFIMTITAVYGFNWIEKLNIVAVPALIVILVYAMVVVFKDPASVTAIQSHNPMPQASMVTAVGTAIGGFASGAALSGDVTRYCKSRKDVIISSIVGVLPVGVGTMLAGAILAIHSGAIGMDTGSIVTMLSSVGSPILGLLVLVLATWTTNVSNAYSSGFALLSLTNAKDNKRPVFVFVAGIAGTLLAVLGITNYFNAFLNILAVFIPPIIGVVAIDYFILRKGDPKKWRSMPGINWAGVISWGIGSVVAILLPGFFIPTLNAIIISCVLYLLLYHLFYKNRKEDAV